MNSASSHGFCLAFTAAFVAVTQSTGWQLPRKTWEFGIVTLYHLLNEFSTLIFGKCYDVNHRSDLNNDLVACRFSVAQVLLGHSSWNLTGINRAESQNVWEFRALGCSDR